jgi:tRNA (guanine-N7-)-methyltransferase
VSHGGPASPLIRTYGRRHGHRLRDSRTQLIESLLPRLRLWAAGDDQPNQRIADPHALFDVPTRDIWLEIGFGGGEHLAGAAAANRDIGLIGCEPFINGVASLLRHVADVELTNVRVHDGDARTVIDALPDASIGRVYLLFPDPWPKSRHHKRRIVSPLFLDMLARIMVDGAELCFATDHHEYAVWTLERLIAHPAFTWSARSRRDWQRPDGWIETRYEAKALAAGRLCLYFTAVRQPRQVGR